MNTQDTLFDLEWACYQCGAGYFGTPPDDELCPACRPGLSSREAS